MIKKEGNKFVLYSKDGSKKLGTFGSKRQAEEREAEINRIKHAKSELVEVLLTITKASLQDDGTMRWQAVASDTAPDRTGERTSLQLFEDWIERADNGKSVDWLPPARKPFLGLSHYPDLDGLAEAGPTNHMWVQGNTFKADGVFYPDDDHPLGKALFDAVRNEKALIKKGQVPKNPIRISAAWYDITHKHGDFVFERKSLDDRCPMCAKGGSDKEYLRGQLDHFAATRVPINPRTDLQLTERAMTTRKEDAESIIDDPELIEEIDQKARLLGKSETEQEAPEAMVVKADEPDETVVERMEDDEHHRPFGGAMTLTDAEQHMEGQERRAAVHSNWGMFNAVMQNVIEQSDPGQIKANVQDLLTEFSDRVAAIKAAIEDVTLLEPVIEQANFMKGVTNMETQDVQHPFDVIKAEYDRVLADPTLDRAAKHEALQKQLNTLGQAMQAGINGVAPSDPGEAVAKAFTPIAEKLDLLLAKLNGQQPAAQPQQKSFTPTGPTVQVQPDGQPPVSPVTGQPSALTQMIRRSVGIQQ